jgi:hypothetical protein
VPYDVQTAENVENALRDYPGISEASREALINGYLTDLANDADHYLERYPTGHESLLFHYEFSFLDGGQCHSFTFLVDGSEMASGVVTVLWVDWETFGPM